MIGAAVASFASFFSAWPGDLNQIPPDIENPILPLSIA